MTYARNTALGKWFDMHAWAAELVVPVREGENAEFRRLAATSPRDRMDLQLTFRAARMRGFHSPDRGRKLRP